MCWYDPPEHSKVLIKNLCEQIVNEVQRLERDGDPLSCRMKDIHELLNHLYDPDACKEKKNQR